MGTKAVWISIPLSKTNMGRINVTLAYIFDGEIKMLIYAIIVFAIAAVGGLVLAAQVLYGKFAPWALSLLHAALGAIGLVLLITLLAQDNMSPKVLIGFILMLVAALGGGFLASFHVRRKLPPKAVVVIHPGVAIVGFLTLASVLL